MECCRSATLAPVTNCVLQSSKPVGWHSHHSTIIPPFHHSICYHVQTQERTVFRCIFFMSRGCLLVWLRRASRSTVITQMHITPYHRGFPHDGERCRESSQRQESWQICLRHHTGQNKPIMCLMKLPGTSKKAGYHGPASSLRTPLSRLGAQLW